MIFNEMTGFSKERKSTIRPPFSKSCKTDVMPSIQKQSGIKKTKPENNDKIPILF